MTLHQVFCYALTVNNIDEVRAALSNHKFAPLNLGITRQAAVAIVLRAEYNQLEVLLIERASHKNDPWSGQMAFPGGRREQEDVSAQAAAERETREELGVSLENAEFLGRIDELQGRHSGRAIDLVISPFVYFLEHNVVLSPNYEVADAVWVPFSTLQNMKYQVMHVYDRKYNRTHPGIRLGENDTRIVWGLTYRFLGSLFGILGSAVPEVQSAS